MSKYKEMYYKLLYASEVAINSLIEAQRECEELYLSSCSSDCKVLSLLTRDNSNENNNK